MSQPLQHEWLKKTGDDLQADYERIRDIARQPSGIQQSGHEAEAAWKQLLEAWLPPNYRIGVRKYLLFETPVDGTSQSREHDLVIFHPGYPEALRTKPQVVISGVVAAFSVKLTLNRAGIEEAIEDAAVLRRGIEVKKDKTIGNLLSPLIFGVLAHSHKSLGNPPDRTVDRLLQQSSADVSVPRESLDLVCIADSNCWRRWVTIDIPWPPGHPFHSVRDRDKRPIYGQAFASMGERLGDAPQENYPVAALIGGLWDLLAQRDESLRGIADGLWKPYGIGGVSISRELASVIQPAGALYQRLNSQPGPSLL